MTEKRYLPLIQDNGEWIDRPDLFILARMGVDDTEGYHEADHVYASMTFRKDATERFSSFEKDIEARQVRKNMQLRLFAGQAILELVRIAATTHKPPSAAQGIRLAAFNHQRTFKRSSVESLEREVRRGLTKYRSTAHLQAAMVLGDPSVADMEASPEGTKRFLARARGLETFVDNSVVSDSFEWNPWRVPVRVDANYDFNHKPLCQQERAFLKLP
jgi:hypothetical protein